MHWSWDFQLDKQNRSTWLALDISFASPCSRELSAKQVPRHQPGRFWFSPSGASWGIVFLHDSDGQCKCTVRSEKYAYTSYTTALPFQWETWSLCVLTFLSHIALVSSTVHEPWFAHLSSFRSPPLNFTF